MVRPSRLVVLQPTKRCCPLVVLVARGRVQALKRRWLRCWRMCTDCWRKRACTCLPHRCEVLSAATQQGDVLSAARAVALCFWACRCCGFWTSHPDLHLPQGPGIMQLGPSVSALCKAYQVKAVEVEELHARFVTMPRPFWSASRHLLSSCTVVVCSMNISLARFAAHSLFGCHVWNECMLPSLMAMFAVAWTLQCGGVEGDRGTCQAA